MPGGLFAPLHPLRGQPSAGGYAPAGWKPKKKPNLVFGILGDTHLQSVWDGVTPHAAFPLTYVTNAMQLFQNRGIDAFMHLGDAAHRGKNVEVQYHRDIFEKCFPHGKAKDGRTVEKLLVVGNHHQFRSSLKELPNAVSFFGHWHCSNADWKTIYYDGWSFPEIC